MCRVKVVILVLLCLGLAASAQITGRWSTDLAILPSLAVDRTQFEINYSIAETWTGTARIDLSSSYSSAHLRLRGALDAVQVVGELQFDVQAVAYRSASLLAAWSWYGMYFAVGVTHWAPDYAPARPCLEPGSPYLEYRLQLGTNTFSFLGRFEDCAGGTQWRDVTITLRESSLCCDITVRGTAKVSKDMGFEKLSLTIAGVPLWPGGKLRGDIVLDFTVEEKSVSLRPKFEFLHDACLTVYGDLETGEDGASIAGLEVQGFSIKCALSECQEVELKTAFVPGTLGFEEDESEYVKIQICLPACCGREGRLTITPYFGANAGLGLTRVLTKAELPLLSNFSVKAEVEITQDGDVEIKAGFRMDF